MYCANCYSSIPEKKLAKLVPLTGHDGVKRYFFKESCRDEYKREV